MRYAIIVAAFGIALGAPVLMPTSAMNQASAQDALPAAEQTTLQTQIDAIMFNDALTDAEVADQIQALVTGSTDPVAATNLVINSVARAPARRRAAMGTGIGQASQALATTDPITAGNIQTAVAVNAPTDVQVAFVSAPPPTFTPPIGGGLPPVPGGGPPRGGPPTDPVVPTIPEPNPAQIVPVEVLVVVGGGAPASP
jgi:hypothetical protein